MIVVDTDVISFFWLQTDRLASARKARRKDSTWVSPLLWRSEFRSVLRTYMQQGLLTYAQALWYTEQAERSMRGYERRVSSADVLKLVERTGHSASDCEYVALAQQLGIPLVTGDQRLARLFPEDAVLLEDYASS